MEYTFVYNQFNYGIYNGNWFKNSFVVTFFQCDGVMLKQICTTVSMNSAYQFLFGLYITNIHKGFTF